MGHHEDSTGKTHEHDACASVHPDAVIILTQAFCPNGHNLVRRDDVLFEGHPGISVLVKSETFTGEVVLSPVYGDPTRVGAPSYLVPGTAFELCCPECDVALPMLAPCPCGGGGKLISLYLKKGNSEGHQVGICNVFGCHRSRVLDSLELISELVGPEDPS